MVDFIGFFENLTEDFLYIQNKIGADGELQSLNVTGARAGDYKSYYNDETRKIVADVFQEDIRIFGYTFDNSSLHAQVATRKA